MSAQGTPRPERPQTQTHCPCGNRLVWEPEEERAYFDDGRQRCSVLCDGVNYDD